jgi:HEAT repeat protein
MNAAGELGSDGAALAVARLADADLDVRMAAARAAIAAGRRDAAIATLVTALDGPRRLDAADELARLGDARGLAVLTTTASASADARARRAAVTLLTPLPSARPALVAAMDDADGSVRLAAAGALLRRFFR